MTTASDMSSRLLDALADRPSVWRFIASFAADWRSPLEPGDGHDTTELDAAEARLGVKLPAALREAYALFGRRDDLTRNQDELLTPSELNIYQGALVYQAENQGAAHWGILLSDLGNDDPATVMRPDLADKSQERWEPWTERLSVALIDLVMSETAYYEADGLSDGAELDDDVLAAFHELPTVLPAQHESSWYLGDDVLLHVRGGWWLTVRARTAQALDAVRENHLVGWVNG